MKKLLMALMAMTAFVAVNAASVTQVSVVENEITSIDVPFGIRGYSPSNKDVVRIEPSSDRALRITALKRGRCDLEVRGDEGIVQKFEITVLGDLATELETLTMELDRVQEVRARIVGNSIRIDGEISAIDKWEYLMKVLRGYGGSVRNFVTFVPGPEVLLRMKETLQQAGFAVVFEPLGKDRKAWKANTIALALNKKTRIMTVQGRVYTPEQQAMALQCLKSERWLSLDLDADKFGDDDFRVRSMVDVFVDRPQVRISLAYMAIGDEDLKQIGNPNATQGTGVLNVEGLVQSLGQIFRDGARDSIGGGQRRSNAHTVGYAASVNVLARFMKNNGITRVSDTGYTVMESWDKDGASFKSGGTIYVPVPGNVGGDLKEIEYGFILKTVGGVVASGDAVDMSISFEVSKPSGDAVNGYDVSQDQSKQKLILPLGKTTFIGGVKMLDDKRMSPSGLPILRNTPMLNWFVADSGTDISDRRLVIMICPEIIDNSTGEKVDTVKEVDIPVTTEGAKTTEQREEEKRPFSGGLWNPLNWFVF